MFCLKVQQSSGPRNLQGVLMVLGLGGSTSETRFHWFWCPYKNGPKIKVGFTGLWTGNHPNGRWCWFSMTMSTLTFFWGVSFPHRTCRETKKNKPTKPRLTDSQNLRSYDSLIIRLETKALRHWSRYLVINWKVGPMVVSLKLGEVHIFWRRKNRNDMTITQRIHVWNI